MTLWIVSRLRTSNVFTGVTIVKPKHIQKSREKLYNHPTSLVIFDYRVEIPVAFFL